MEAPEKTFERKHESSKQARWGIQIYLKRSDTTLALRCTLMQKLSKLQIGIQFDATAHEPGIPAISKFIMK